MYSKDNSVPLGAPEDARLKAGSAAEEVAYASGAAVPPSASAPAEPCEAPGCDVQSPADVPPVSSSPCGPGDIEQAAKVAFFNHIEKTANLEERAFQLRFGRFKPYDERTRGLVASVADQGLVGAVVQHLLQTPQLMPESILKPVRQPRLPKLKRVKPPKSLYETLSDEDDEAA